MPAKGLSMRKIREILRLRYEVGLSSHQIAASCSVGRTAVVGYLRRAAAAGVTWPLPEGMDETRFVRGRFKTSQCGSVQNRPVDFAYESTLSRALSLEQALSLSL